MPTVHTITSSFASNYIFYLFGNLNDTIKSITEGIIIVNNCGQPLRNNPESNKHPELHLKFDQPLYQDFLQRQIQMSHKIYLLYLFSDR